MSEDRAVDPAALPLPAPVADEALWPPPDSLLPKGMSWPDDPPWVDR